MGIRRFIDVNGCDPASILEFIHNAFEEGDGVAVDMRYLDVINRSDPCSPCCSGKYEGCYLFDGVAAHSRVSSLFNVLGAFAALLLLLPLLFLIFLLVLLQDGAPVVFRQKRYGLHNQEFDIYKFRTMVLNGEKLHVKMQRRWGKEGQLFKMDKDPRVTRFGAILRAAYLDELPQLFNVLKGDMRLCGPRPLPESDKHHYVEAYHSLRLLGVPGVTGLWQIKGRNEVSFDEMCLLDVYYLCNNTFRMDMQILLHTAKLLLTHRG